MHPAQPRKLRERFDDRAVGGTHRVEEIARDEDGVDTARDDGLDRRPERVGDVGLALVGAVGRQPLELPEAEMGVGKVCDSHVRLTGTCPFP